MAGKEAKFSETHLCFNVPDENYATLKSEKERAKLEKEVCHLYVRITGQVLTAPIIRREYEAF